MTNQINFNFFDTLLETTSSEEITASHSSESNVEPIRRTRSKPSQQTSQSQPQQGVSHLLKREIKRIIEALLFSAYEPISFKKMREILHAFCPIKPRILAETLQELKEEYQVEQRAFQLEEIAQGYILRTRDIYNSYVHMLHGNRRGEKLSQAATEVLAIIAYRQPLTRPEIEAIRGVDSSGTIYSLLERGLIQITGRLDAPGRPSLYSTTPAFLQHFGLNGIDELPQIEELRQKS